MSGSHSNRSQLSKIKAGIITTAFTATSVAAKATSLKTSFQRWPITIWQADDKARQGYIPGKVTITSAKAELHTQYNDSKHSKIAPAANKPTSRPFCNMLPFWARAKINIPAAAGNSWAIIATPTKLEATIGAPALYSASRTLTFWPASRSRSDQTIASQNKKAISPAKNCCNWLSCGLSKPASIELNNDTAVPKPPRLPPKTSCVAPFSLTKSAWV